MIIIAYRPPKGSPLGDDDYYLSEEITYEHVRQVVKKRWVRTASLARFYEEVNTACEEYKRLRSWIEAGMPRDNSLLNALPPGGKLMALTVTIGRALAATDYAASHAK